MKYFRNGKPIRLSPKTMIGKGGEADIYTLNRTEVVKLFKPPTHPDLQHDQASQQAAQDRLREHQIKLRQFPQNLPQTVLKPQDLVCDRYGKILGYIMPYLPSALPLYRYGDRRFRQQHGIDAQQVSHLFLQLHQTLSQVHQAGVVVGDFNDLNVLVQQQTPYLIDADSFQFGSFVCQLFTTRFVDPVLCDRQLSVPQLISAHNAESDWYAFSVMLFRSLLYVEPYGGIYPDKTVPQTARPLLGISVFHPRIKYPKPALPYGILPDDLLHYFQQCFDGRQRGIFPLQLLQQLHWQTCPVCGQAHARQTCSDCQTTLAMVQPTPQTKGLTLIFSTSGVILATELQPNSRHWLYWEQGAFKRETGQTLFCGDRHPHLHFWIQGDRTYIGKEDTILCFVGNTLQSDQNLQVDTYRQRPAFSCIGGKRYWVQQGKLWRDGSLGNVCIGDILSGQTQFWVGEHLGFGFYQAGHLLTGFVFDLHRSGLNDQIPLPQITGEIIDTHCIIGDRQVWFFITEQAKGKVQHRLSVINPRGQVLAQRVFSPTELPSIYGHGALNADLLVATDQGLEQWCINNTRVELAHRFSETAAHIHSNQEIIPVLSSQHSPVQKQTYVLDSQNLWQLY